LADERSKQILIELLAYKLLGYTKVKLSLNNEYYWRLRKSTYRMCREEKVKVDFQEGYLHLFDLKPIGYNIKIYYIMTGILNDFLLEQYKYKNLIKVDTNDIVIDAGGCWGDTALYFAALGAANIFSFEFIESNVDIMKKNMNLNDHLKKKIQIVERPLWDHSDVKMSYQDRGPASKVDIDDKYRNSVLTITIDDIVKQKNIDRIDFIKMDIEGAEFNALKGAENTIKAFKPKLAISAYHKFDDLYRLPKLIKSIRNDYRFYLDYYTIVADEIILYAI
jgi:FkbM family methyltransferase